MFLPDVQDVEDLISDPNPLWLWDGISGRIFWANDAGLKFWQVDHLIELQALQFDHSMPALRRLRQLALSELPVEGQDERLLFWSDKGNRQVNCCCLKLAVDGYGDLLLLRVNQPAPDPSERVLAEPDQPKQLDNISAEIDLVEYEVKPDGLPEPAPPPSSSRPASSDEDDVAATLREIARQVRAEGKQGDKQGANRDGGQSGDKRSGTAVPTGQLSKTGLNNDPRNNPRINPRIIRGIRHRSTKSISLPGCRMKSAPR